MALKQRSMFGRVVPLLLALLLSLPSSLVLAGSTLSLTGPLVEQKGWMTADLAQLPQTEIVASRSVNSGQGQETSKTTYQGVLLRDLLQAAKLHEEARHDFRRMLVIARASDGYVALFTWGELFNTKLGDQVLVITSVDGRPLADSEGPYALRSLGDLRPGPRHVKWLKHIEVIRIGS